VWCHSNLLPGLRVCVRRQWCGQTFVVVAFVPLILQKKKKKIGFARGRIHVVVTARPVGQVSSGAQQHQTP
jgi:hypothetical protein